MRRQLVFVAGSLVVTALLAVAKDGTRSVQSGVFTAEQAQRGAQVFEDACKKCHQPEEYGDGIYMEGWSGQLASDMIDQLRSTMPQDNPGSLKRMDYVDLAAYLFELNALPTGEAEMDTDNTKSILIEGPYGSSSDPDR